MSAPTDREAAEAGRAELRGIGLFLLAIFLFSIMDSFAKHLVARHDPVQVVWARYVSQTFWAFLMVSPWLPGLLRTAHPRMQLIRSALLFGATFCFFSSLEFMGLAETVAVFEMGPLWITALAFFVLKEPVGPRRWTGVAIGFVGAMIIIRPGGEVFTLASFLPMAGALCFAGYAIATRTLGDDEGPWTAFLYTALFGALAASLAVPFFWTTPSLSDGVIMSTFGIIGGAGHLSMIMALRHAAASVVAPFQYAGLIYATFWGFVIFGEVPDGWTMVGAAVIVAAGLYVWWRERVRQGA
ncbi:MAG: DMT family transporter [Pseudomonadota bacterium]